MEGEEYAVQFTKQRGKRDRKKSGNPLSKSAYNLTYGPQEGGRKRRRGMATPSRKNRVRGLSYHGV